MGNIQIRHWHKCTHKIRDEDHFHGTASTFTLNHTNEGINKPKFIRFLLLLKWNSVKQKTDRTARDVGEKELEMEERNLHAKVGYAWGAANVGQMHTINRKVKVTEPKRVFVSVLANVFVCFGGVRSSITRRDYKRNFLSDFFKPAKHRDWLRYQIMQETMNRLFNLSPAPIFTDTRHLTKVTESP